MHFNIGWLKGMYAKLKFLIINSTGIQELLGAVIRITTIHSMINTYRLTGAHHYAWSLVYMYVDSCKAAACISHRSSKHAFHWSNDTLKSFHSCPPKNKDRLYSDSQVHITRSLWNDPTALCWGSASQSPERGCLNTRNSDCQVDIWSLHSISTTVVPPARILNAGYAPPNEERSWIHNWHPHAELIITTKCWQVPTQ